MLSMKLTWNTNYDRWDAYNWWNILWHYQHVTRKRNSSSRLEDVNIVNHSTVTESEKDSQMWRLTSNNYAKNTRKVLETVTETWSLPSSLNNSQFDSQSGVRTLLKEWRDGAKIKNNVITVFLVLKRVFETILRSTLNEIWKKNWHWTIDHKTRLRIN
jgi:hypothetical protein